MVTHWADEKSFPLAAARLELPEIAHDLVRWEELLEFPRDHLERVCNAYLQLGELAQTKFYSNLSLPGAMQLVGDWNLFWPGNRIHTMERLLAELPQTLQWSQSLRQQGKLAEARYILWPCDPESIRKRTAALCEVLKPLGYDIEDLTESFSNSTLLSDCEAELAACLTSGAQRRISDRDAAEVINLAKQVLERLEAHAQV